MCGFVGVVGGVWHLAFVVGCCDYFLCFCFYWLLFWSLFLGMSFCYKFACGLGWSCRFVLVVPSVCCFWVVVGVDAGFAFDCLVGLMICVFPGVLCTPIRFPY